MDIGEIPREWSTPPTQLIAVTGLDTVNNDVHKTIWSAFVVHRRADRLPLNFMQLSVDHSFPMAKPKRTTYDGYMPGGVLKTNWAHKHLTVVPSVIVLFIDLDWNDPNWNEKKTECQSKVDSLRFVAMRMIFDFMKRLLPWDGNNPKAFRHSLEGRNTRIAVVLVQRVAPMPAGEDVVAAERATQLCTSCDISPKALFVLPQADHQFGYILRLEQAFHELAQAYYAAEIRRVKAKKELLSKSMHQALLIRCQFKLAMFNELRQDTHTALRHYKLGYQHLTEAFFPELNWFEWKTVAGILNYSICRLCFVHNTPLDAIQHFRRHVDFFTLKIGSRPDGTVAQIEHHAWLCRQYATFGEQFESAIQGGLAAIQTQHPGFYYQSAAQQAAKRRDLVQQVSVELRTTGAVYPEADDPLQHQSKIVFCGQRPWRIGLTPDDPADEHMEAQAALAIKVNESQRDLCAPVMQYYNACMLQFKRYRCARMRRRVMVLLAREYVLQQQHARALQLYMHVIWEYRAERWWSLVHVLCLDALQCAHTLANVNEYVTLALQLLNPVNTNNVALRQQIAANLQLLLAGQIPNALILDESTQTELGVDSRGLRPDLAVANWQRVLTERCFFMVQMQPIYPAIIARAAFRGHDREKHTITIDKPLTVRVTVHSLCPMPLTFRKLTVSFDPAASHPPQFIENIPDLTLNQGDTREFEFPILLSPTDLDADITISSISLDIGSLQAPVCGSLHWDGAGSMPANAIPPEYACMQSSRSPFWLTSNQSYVHVERRMSTATLTVDAPDVMLQTDVRTVIVKIENTEATKMSNIRLHLNTRCTDDQQQLNATQESSTSTTQTSSCAFTMFSKALNQCVNVFDTACADLPSGESVCCKGGNARLPVRCSSELVGQFAFDIQMTYDIDVGVKQGVNDHVVRCECMIDKTVNVTVNEPFECRVRTTSVVGEPMDHVISVEPLLLHLDVTARSQILLHSICWKLAPCIVLDRSTNAQVSPDVVLHDGDVYSSVVLISIPMEQTAELPFGTADICWSRHTTSPADDSPRHNAPYQLHMHHVLPTLAVRSCPILVSIATLPAFASVRQPLPVIYNVVNVGQHVRAVTLTLNAADSFMFSGRKQCQLRLLPGDTRKLSYVFFPLVAGFVRLPTFQFGIVEGADSIAPDGVQQLQDTLNTLAQRTIPQQIFVLPIHKQLTKSDTAQSIVSPGSPPQQSV